MNLTRIVPMLPVRSMPAAIAFYEKLGFGVERRNDTWRWAMLSFGDCRLMVDESINTDPASPRGSVIYLYPDDIAEFHRRARAHGLEVPELEDTFYSMTEFRMEDPDGNRLWIGQSAAAGS